MKKYQQIVEESAPVIKRVMRHLMLYFTPIFGVLLLLYIGYSDKIESEDAWFPILQSLGIALLMSGAISFWASIINSFDFFSEKLSKIIFGDEFIKHRKDLDKIWDKVSRAMYHEKFPEISEKLQTTIKEIYFPTNYFYYTDYYDMTIKFEFVGEQNEYVKVIETSKQKIVAHSTTKFCAPFSNVINVNSDGDEITQIEIKHLEVNKRKLIDESKQIKHGDEDGSDIIATEEVKVELYNKGNEIGFKGKINLTGANEYIIVKQLEKVYSLNLNPLKVFAANNIYKKLLVSIDKPKDLFLDFTSMGTTTPFEKILTDDESERIRYIQRDLIMYNQGYVIGIANRPK